MPDLTVSEWVLAAYLFLVWLNARSKYESEMVGTAILPFVGLLVLPATTDDIASSALLRGAAIWAGLMFITAIWADPIVVSFNLMATGAAGLLSSLSFLKQEPTLM
ncbi:MAG TPA: hypothetical protein VKA25_07215 [Gemmatimonadales bacterium]|nr:hypothetical protein [Gemmatimonadales bacterium]